MLKYAHYPVCPCVNFSESPSRELVARLSASPWEPLSHPSLTHLLLGPLLSPSAPRRPAPAPWKEPFSSEEEGGGGYPRRRPPERAGAGFWHRRWFLLRQWLPTLGPWGPCASPAEGEASWARSAPGLPLLGSFSRYCIRASAALVSNDPGARDPPRQVTGWPSVLGSVLASTCLMALIDTCDPLPSRSAFGASLQIFGDLAFLRSLAASMLVWVHCPSFVLFI